MPNLKKNVVSVSFLPWSGRQARVLVGGALALALMSATPRAFGATDDAPVMPARFDAPTVQGLVDHIDEGRNASILKGVYFNPHFQQALPLADGLKLLKASLQKQPPETKRWYYLESTYAFAAVRVAPANLSEGLKAYEAIFDRAKQAIGAGAAYPLQRSVYEFVFTMPTSYLLPNPDDAGDAPRTLYKAFDAYLLLLKAKQEGPVEPEWERVVQYSAFDARYGKAIEAALKDPEMPRSASFYKLVDVFQCRQNTDGTLKLLQDAKASLPAASSLGGKEQARDLYRMIVDLALLKGDWPLAISSQQELIQRTGRGRARLAMLYLQSHKATEYNETAVEMRKPDANETDINDLASALLRWGHKDAKRLPRLQREADTLLKGYLDAPRTRANDEELVARLTLAQSYIDQKRTAEARAVLAAAKLEPGAAGSDAAALYAVSQRMQMSLERKSVQTVLSAPKNASTVSPEKSSPTHGPQMSGLHGPTVGNKKPEANKMIRKDPINKLRKQ